MRETAQHVSRGVRLLSLPMASSGLIRVVARVRIALFYLATLPRILTQPARLRRSCRGEPRLLARPANPFPALLSGVNSDDLVTPEPRYALLRLLPLLGLLSSTRQSFYPQFSAF